MKPILIYIAGPYMRPDPAKNVRAAIDLAEYLAIKGYEPFIPHLTHFWHMIHHHPYEFWLKRDLFMLAKCDALVRIQGESSGADGEVQEAIKLGIPVGEFLGFSAAGMNALDKWLETLEA